MNNGYQKNSYTITSSTNTTSNTDGFLIGGVGVIIFGILFGITIFVIWVWSMISMINLNIRFKDFYEDYWADDAERHRSTPTENNRVKLNEYKTEEGRVAEHRQKIESMKPRKTFLWIAFAGIPVLLIILVIASTISY